MEKASQFQKETDQFIEHHTSTKDDVHMEEEKEEDYDDQVMDTCGNESMMDIYEIELEEATKEDKQNMTLMRDNLSVQIMKSSHRAIWDQWKFELGTYTKPLVEKFEKEVLEIYEFISGDEEEFNLQIEQLMELKL